MSVQLYNVTFWDGAIQLDTHQMPIGEYITIPASISKPGYVFLGFFTTSDGSTPFNFNEPVTQSVNIYTKWTTVSSWRYVLTIQWINHCGNGCSAAYVSIPQGTYLDLTTLRYIVNTPDETLFNPGEYVHWPLNSDYFNVVYTNRSTNINYDTTVLIDYNKVGQGAGYQFTTGTMNYYNPWGLAVFLAIQNITIDVDEYTTPTITWN